MRPVYRKGLALLKPRRHLVLGALAFSLLGAATNAGYALVFGRLAGYLFGAEASAEHAGPRPATALLLSVGGVALVRMISTLGSAWVTARLGTEIAHELRCTLYAHTAANALPRTLAHHRGELVSRLQSDVATIQSSLVSSIVGLSETVLSMLMVGAVILSIDPWVALVCLVGAPVAALIVRSANRKLYALYRELRADYGLLDGRIEEIVDVGDVVRSFGAERRMAERFVRISERVRGASFMVGWTAAFTKPLISVAAALGIGGLVVYWQVAGAPPPTEQASLLAAGAILMRPVHVASRLLESFTWARASLSRVDEILGTPLPDFASDPLTRGGASLLEVEGLAFGYGGEHRVLSDISFRLARGQVLAVVGASGTGKTTLLRLVAGLLEPQGGTRRVDGQSIDEMGIRNYRSRFGWVPQEARLLFDTVAENLRLGRPEASEEQLQQALHAAGFELSRSAFPAGLGTVVGDDGSPFSVGQRQRLCIARALAAGAPILVLDEPTAALDERQAEELHRTLETLRERVVVLLATHRLSSVQKSDWVIVLEEGRIVEQGTPNDLLAHGARFRHLFAQELIEREAPRASGTA